MKKKLLRILAVALCTIGIVFAAFLIANRSSRPPADLKIEWRGVDTGYSNSTVIGTDRTRPETEPARANKEHTNHE